MPAITEAPTESIPVDTQTPLHSRSVLRACSNNAIPVKTPEKKHSNSNSTGKGARKKLVFHARKGRMPMKLQKALTERDQCSVNKVPTSVEPATISDVNKTNIKGQSSTHPQFEQLQ